MEACRYDKVRSDEINCSGDDSRNISWKPVLRQLFICSGIYTIYFALGLCFGAPTVFIPQLRREANSSEAVSVEMESWLTSIHGYSALPWVVVIPILALYKGRKMPFLLMCVTTIISYVVFYYSVNTMQLLISEIVQGILLASNITLLTVIGTEYTSPQYRGVFISIKSTLFFWGIWIANATGTFFHWKNIGILALFCSVYSLTAVVWPESPSWLAMNGRFEECAELHHWLKGFNKDSERELECLINSQKEYHIIDAEYRIKGFTHGVKAMLETLLKREFYQPLLLTLAVMSLYHFSGKLVCTMYAVELIKQITDSEFSAYMGMLILEGITIAGMHVDCVLAKFTKRKVLLLGSSCVGIVFLFVISLYLYLFSLFIINENKYVSILLPTMFSVSISCGPMVVPEILFGEIIFLRYKSSSLLILTLYSEFLMATILKLAPYLFKMLTLHAFFFYGVSASCFTLVLYKYLPETKDKTLQEIEGFFKE